MKETQSEIARRESTNLPLMESLSAQSTNNNNNVKYYKLKDLIDQDTRSNVASPADTVEKPVKSPAPPELKTQPMAATASIVSRTQAKHLPRQPPKPRLAANTSQNKTRSQNVSSLSKITTVTAPTLKNEPIFKTENVASLIKTKSPAEKSPEKLESVSSYSWLTPQISLSKHNDQKSSQSLSYSPLLSNKTESLNMSTWSNSDNVATPPPQFDSKFFQPRVGSHTTSSPKMPVQQPRVHIIMDPRQMAQIPATDESYLKFELSEVHTLKNFSSLDELLRSLGVKRFSEDQMAVDAECSEISEIILII